MDVRLLPRCCSSYVYLLLLKRLRGALTVAGLCIGLQICLRVPIKTEPDGMAVVGCHGCTPGFR